MSREPNNSFATKWAGIQGATHLSETDENVLFVAPGKEPVTQRQLNLYYYYIFVRDVFRNILVKDTLEVGCGRGTLSLYLGRYLGLTVNLLDNEPDAIALAQREFAARHQEANFFVADALHTGLPAQSFDATLSIGLAEHIDDVRALFAEQYRLLRSGGVMISLNIPKKFSIQYLNRLYRLVRKLLGKYKEDVRKDYYRNALQAPDYIRIAREVGFQDLVVTHVCPFPVYVPLSIAWDKKITKVRKIILKIRSLFLSYPYQSTPLFAQAHFLVAYKQ